MHIPDKQPAQFLLLRLRGRILPEISIDPLRSQRTYILLQHLKLPLCLTVLLQQNTRNPQIQNHLLHSNIRRQIPLVPVQLIIPETMKKNTMQQHMQISAHDKLWFLLITFQHIHRIIIAHLSIRSHTAHVIPLSYLKPRQRHVKKTQMHQYIIMRQPHDLRRKRRYFRLRSVFPMQCALRIWRTLHIICRHYSPPLPCLIFSCQRLKTIFILYPDQRIVNQKKHPAVSTKCFFVHYAILC